MRHSTEGEPETIPHLQCLHAAVSPWVFTEVHLIGLLRVSRVSTIGVNLFFSHKCGMVVDITYHLYIQKKKSQPQSALNLTREFDMGLLIANQHGHDGHF